MRLKLGINRVRPAIAIAALVAVAGACRDDGARLPLASTEQVAARVNVGLEVSSLTAGAGERIAVAIRASGDQTIGGLQGILYFDAARLRYLGQDVGDALVMVNDGAAGRGQLRVLSVNVNGLDTRTGVLVFEVSDSRYTRGLRYELESMVSKDVREILASSVTINSEVETAASLTVPEGARRMRLQDWDERLAAATSSGDLDVQATPGQYLLNLRYGDANLSGSLNVLDVSYIANVAVGNNQIIVGTDAPSRDAVVAGNVRPANNPGLGEATDANPPGLETNGTRVINVFDVLAVANEVVGNAQDIVAELIPGRGPLATNVVMVPAGSITTNTTWTRDNIYQLQGIVRVNSGATLTIEAGTRIEGISTAASSLFIERDGYAIAVGTALEPIVMTCVGNPVGTRVKGCWSGLWIAGNAGVNGQQTGLPTSPAVKNSAGGCNQRQGEGGGPLYGGCDPADSSGVFRYIRVEYAGFILGGANELNGITAGGVGTGTDIDHIQVHAGLDDGFEIFGGTFSIKYLYLTANSDDAFDFTFGWNGRAQYVIVQQDSLDSDKGFEVDNGEGDVPHTATPRVNPTIYNVTLVGERDTLGTGGAATNNVNDAMHLRRGMGGQFRNFLVLAYNNPLDIDDAPTCVDINAATGLSITNSVFARMNTTGNSDADPAPCGPYPGPSDAEAEFLQDPANSNSFVYGDSLMVSPYHQLLPDFRLNASLVGATPPSDGFFTTSATHIGAVEARNATGSNIPWYSGWTRGWQALNQP